VRKPAREWWIRVHPDPAYHIETAVLELKEDREVYLVESHLWPELSTESTFGPRAVFTTVNTLGVVFLWPIRLPAADGKIDEWSRSALESALLAREKWVRIQANMSLGAYEVLTSDNHKPAVWPTASFRDLLQIAFTVCAPVHDALLIEADIDAIDDVVKSTQAIMEQASRFVLADFTIRTEANVIRYPDRYMDDRGKTMWNTVMGLLDVDHP
jgi:hypothetical protein